ncbi:MAG TPA: hypothetical protein VNM66_07960 [Thermodesulfobacteriota bacterium]|nr:hypothetical protein [Thermodesulfobacteriota bacterium]
MKPDAPRAEVVGDSLTSVAGDRVARDRGAEAPLPRGRFCAFCGIEVSERRPATERFGEPFCSEAHAEAFVKDVRAARVQAAAAAVRAGVRGVPSHEADGTGATSGVAPAPPTWREWLGRWSCRAAPVLLLAGLLLVGLGSGGGAAAAASLLSVLALVACPLGMALMIWAMGRKGHGTEVPRAPKGHGAERTDG